MVESQINVVVVVEVLAYLIKLFWGVQGRNCACTFRYCSPTISLFFLLYLCFNSQHCSTWLFQSNISQPSILEELENSFCALIFLKQIDFFFREINWQLGGSGKESCLHILILPPNFFHFSKYEFIFCDQMNCIILIIRGNIYLCTKNKNLCTSLLHCHSCSLFSF